MWGLLRRWYLERCPHVSFLTYYWSIRSTHLPLFALARVAAGAPHAAVYHSVATGFSGFLGGLCAKLTGRPLLLTEHGIYTKERRIELLQTSFSQGPMAQEDPERVLEQRTGPLRQLWTGFFEGIGRMTYAVADPIVTLYEGNRQRQIREGAPADRIRIVPNGIAVDRYRPLRREEVTAPRPVVAFIGRVVPIKDVKAFVRAMREIREERPDVEGWIVGNANEDPEYAEQCQALARTLEIENFVHFLGHRALGDILPEVGLVMLTSVSEGQPLVILEAFATGLPVVSTDVGSCREMIEGEGDEDRALGSAGAVVPFAEHVAAANEALSLLDDPDRWRAARAAAVTRVERYYSDERVNRSYEAIYRDLLGA